MTTTTIRLGHVFLGDHIDRLYTKSADGWFHHVDQPESKLRLVKKTKQSCWVELTGDAVAELTDDADYQAEWAEFNPSIRAAARATLRALRQQV